jgi:hypothetical protein
MDFIESMREAAERVVKYAATQGCDVARFRNQYDVFEHQMRSIDFWLEGDTLGYHLRGEIGKLPSDFAGSESLFRGYWDEAGSINDLHQAFRLLHAWLIDAQEIDTLPQRTIHRCMI